MDVLPTLQEIQPELWSTEGCFDLIWRTLHVKSGTRHLYKKERKSKIVLPVFLWHDNKCCRESDSGKSRHHLVIGPSRRSETLSCSILERDVRHRQNILFPGRRLCGSVRVTFCEWCPGFLRADELHPFLLRKPECEDYPLVLSSYKQWTSEAKSLVVARSLL